MDTDIAGFNMRQVMVSAASAEIKNGEVVFVGMRLPMLAFFLAKSLHAADAVGLYELGIARDSVAPMPLMTMGDLPNLSGSLWLADTGDMMGLLQRGLVDASFIGGAQVDRFGNLNTSYVRDKNGKVTRLPGSGGACDLASLGKRHIIIMSHEKHRFVERVDYLTSPGYGTGVEWRKEKGLTGGGPSAVITTLGVLRFDIKTGEMYLASTHPGVTVEDVLKNTGWSLKISDTLSVTRAPGREEIDILKNLDPGGFWTGN